MHNIAFAQKPMILGVQSPDLDCGGGQFLLGPIRLRPPTLGHSHVCKQIASLPDLR